MNGFLLEDDLEWQIPVYAHDMLWLTCGAQSVLCNGTRGAFELVDPDQSAAFLDLTWGTETGPLIARWSNLNHIEPLVLGWAGQIGIGGFVERLHVFETRGLDLVVAEIDGTLLAPDYDRLPTLEDMRQGKFERSNDATDMPDHTYTVITLADTIVAEYLHHALISELAIDCFTTLGAQAGQWHDIVGLPLLAESVSLLAPESNTIHDR